MTSPYPQTPEEQKQWTEDSIAARLADLKAKFEAPRPKEDKR
jgi:hypothetical protein